MDTVTTYRDIVVGMMQAYIQRYYANQDIDPQLIVDEVGGHYLLNAVGWQDHRRVYRNVMHLDIRDSKIWIQNDITEDGAGNLLVEAGVPKEHIVLAFYTESHRQQTEFAVN